MRNRLDREAADILRNDTWEPQRDPDWRGLGSAGKAATIELMLCPTCGAFVRIRNMDLDARVARCAKCAAEFSLPDYVVLSRAPEAGDEWALPLDRSAVRADRVAIVKYASGSTLVYRLMERGVLRILILLLAPCFTPALLFVLAPDWPQRIMGILSPFLIYFALAAALDSAQIRITDSQLTIDYAPLPLLGAGTYARSAVKSVLIEKGADEGGDHFTVRIDVGRWWSPRLAPSFRSQKMAQKIADTIALWAYGERARTS